jgi:cytoskeletal protein CcmA (bactofilin family)
MDNFKQAVNEMSGQEEQGGEDMSYSSTITGDDPSTSGGSYYEARGYETQSANEDSGAAASGSVGSDLGGRFPTAIDRAITKSSPLAGLTGTVIAPGTVIDGNISSNEDLMIYGVVNGDVLNANKLIIHGEVTGSINAKDISLVDSIIAGNVVAMNSTEMTKDSCILGDLTTENVVVSGKVKGNIEARGNGIFKKESIVLGNISVGTIVIEGGAKMRGFVTTTDGDKEVDEDLFPQARL